MKYTFQTDDADEALVIMHAHKMLNTVADIYNLARNQVKHCEPDSDRAVLESIKQMASEAMEVTK
jgi:hypothetical protein